MVQQFKPGIIALTEVLPKNKLFDITPEIYNIPGYIVYHSNLNIGRGLVIYISKLLCTTNLQLDTNFEESIWCKVKLNKTDSLLFGCIYRSPNCSEENTENLFKLMKIVSDTNPSHLLIVGDFNTKDINWVEHTSEANETHVSTRMYKRQFPFPTCSRTNQIQIRKRTLNIRFDIHK